MTFPSAGPTTLDLVKAHLRITDNLDDASISGVVDAVNGAVMGYRVAQVADTPADPPPADWSAWPHIVTGATMLAARVFRRRNTPDGVSALGEQGPVYVQRNDPDVAQLLQLGAYAKPAVG